MSTYKANTPPTRERVAFYFDFISPYSWLALMQAESFAHENEVEWELQPIVYAKLLDATGLIGPAEVESKRRYTFFDVVRLSQRAGLSFQGPPAHPFRSLEALRTACLFLDDPQALALCAGLADAAWGRGQDLTDMQVLATIVEARGLDASALSERIQAQAVKDRLRDHTEQALKRGIFGVPSFQYGQELFWGQDRMSYLADRLHGRAPSAKEAAVSMLKRPKAAQRKHSPGKPSN